MFEHDGHEVYEPGEKIPGEEPVTPGEFLKRLGKKKALQYIENIDIGETLGAAPLAIHIIGGLIKIGAVSAIGYGVYSGLKAVGLIGDSLEDTARRFRENPVIKNSPFLVGGLAISYSSTKFTEGKIRSIGQVAGIAISSYGVIRMIMPAKDAVAMIGAEVDMKKLSPDLQSTAKDIEVEIKHDYFTTDKSEKWLRLVSSVHHRGQFIKEPIELIKKTVVAIADSLDLKTIIEKKIYDQKNISVATGGFDHTFNLITNRPKVATKNGDKYVYTLILQEFLYSKSDMHNPVAVSNIVYVPEIELYKELT